jgi:hypothetical protein
MLTAGIVRRIALPCATALACLAFATSAQAAFSITLSGSGGTFVANDNVAGTYGDTNSITNNINIDGTTNNGGANPVYGSNPGIGFTNFIFGNSQLSAGLAIRQLALSISVASTGAGTLTLTIEETALPITGGGGTIFFSAGANGGIVNNTSGSSQLTVQGSVDGQLTNAASSTATNFTLTTAPGIDAAGATVDAKLILTFTFTGGGGTITLTGNNATDPTSNGGFLELSPAPAPAGLVLIAAALPVLGFAGFRRRRPAC